MRVLVGEIVRIFMLLLYDLMWIFSGVYVIRFIFCIICERIKVYSEGRIC